MNFKIGQKVVCKTDKFYNGIPFGIKKDEIYTIESFVNCINCGDNFLTLIGIDSYSIKGCGKCGSKTGKSNVFCTWRFRALDYAFVEEVISKIKEELVTV